MLMPKFKIMTASLTFSATIYLLFLASFGTVKINKEISEFDLHVMQLERYKDYLVLLGLFTESKLAQMSYDDSHYFDSVNKMKLADTIYPLGEPRLNNTETVVRHLMHDIELYNDLNSKDNSFMFFYRSYSGSKYIFPSEPEDFRSLEERLSGDMCVEGEVCSIKAKEYQLTDRVLISRPHVGRLSQKEVLSIVSPVYYQGVIIGDYVFNVEIEHYMNEVGQSTAYEVRNNINNTIITYPGYPYSYLNFSKTVVADNKNTYTYRYPYSKLIIDYFWLFIALLLVSINYLFYVNKANITKGELVDAKNTALRDQMTGLYNRRIYSTREFTQSVEGNTCSVIVIDGDRIKDINDNLGHTWGDEVIKHIASSMKNVFRRDDFLLRVGGDEFVVIMPNCSIDNARKASEVLKSQVNSFKISSLGFDASVSIGVAFKGENEPLEHALEKADEKLYEQKAQR
ncbi:GGDEF domain-containing protein [Vibrio sp. TMPB1044]|uniref:GGDEF domain-containing protein n=1 Tax=Vibrio sp. TMPB1044 TaxID=3051822 RepID=UPI00255BF027|nr:GGDEF domain-containing protein [Vibrio sp. TMPB1044]MDL5027203.1 GGDEF domain-containing protein [Vibrio sp. TMPB1044]MDN5207331.1 GGDEF domain-containing protein [Vibrio sp. TMPB1044]